MVGILRSVLIGTHHVLVEVLRIADQLQKSLPVALHLVWIDIPDLQQFAFIFWRLALRHETTVCELPFGKLIAISRRMLSVNG